MHVMSFWIKMESRFTIALLTHLAFVQLIDITYNLFLMPCKLKVFVLLKLNNFVIFVYLNASVIVMVVQQEKNVSLLCCCFKQTSTEAFNQSKCNSTGDRKLNR